MIVLGVETSCDETAVAVVKLSGRTARPSVKILSNLVASQHEIHAPFGGVFPELASRRHIEVLRPLMEEALRQAERSWGEIEGIAVTFAPGLVGSLLVGLSFAKAVAFARKIPFIGVSHLEGHLNAPFLEHPEIAFPHIGLIVSGGHTALYLVTAFGQYRFLGGTRDDAAGEAFDKVAKVLGLPYPGGPEIDRLARKGDPTKGIRLPRPQVKGYDFSFSGLKTAMKVGWNGSPRETLALADVCAGFQETVVDFLVAKTLAAARARRCASIVVTGGVACNSRLREKMLETGRRVFFPSPALCADNAAMIAYVGGRYLRAGRRSPLSLNALANLNLQKVTGEP